MGTLKPHLEVARGKLLDTRPWASSAHWKLSLLSLSLNGFPPCKLLEGLTTSQPPVYRPRAYVLLSAKYNCHKHRMKLILLKLIDCGLFMKKVGVSTFCSGRWVRGPGTFLLSDLHTGLCKVHVLFLLGVRIPSRPMPGQLRERKLSKKQGHGIGAANSMQFVYIFFLVKPQECPKSPWVPWVEHGTACDPAGTTHVSCIRTRRCFLMICHEGH